MIWLGYIILIAGFVSSFILGFILIKLLLRREKESQLLTAIVSSLTLSLGLCVLLIIPVDINNANSLTVKGILKEVFVLIPFAYCYYEEGGDESISVAARICNSLKYTIVGVIIVIIIIIVGIFVQAKPRGSLDKTLIKQLFDTLNRGDSMIIMIISILMLIGVPFNICYSSSGINILALSIINVCHFNDLVTKSGAKTQKKKVLHNQYIAEEEEESHTRKGYSKMQDKQNVYRDVIDNESETKSNKLKNCCSTLFLPLRIILGVLFIAMMIFFIIGLVYGSTSRLRLIITKKSFQLQDTGNPFDLLFVSLSSVFPIDWIFIIGFLVFILISSMLTFFTVGIGCPCCKPLFRIRIRRSRQQGVLIFSALILFICFSFLSYIPYMCPQYSYFGSQSYMEQVIPEPEPESPIEQTNQNSINQDSLFGMIENNVIQSAQQPINQINNNKDIIKSIILGDEEENITKKVLCNINHTNITEMIETNQGLAMSTGSLQTSEVKRPTLGQYLDGRPPGKTHHRYCNSSVSAFIYSIPVYLLDIQMKKDKRDSERKQPKMRSIDDFNIEETIGYGSFSSVIKVVFKGNNKLYAIKKLTKSKLVKVQMERTVYIERDILNKCKHSFILKFFGNFQDDEFLYFVLELCRFDLSKLVQKPLHIEVVRFYAAEIVEAIEHLHSKGVIHRDLKPENIFIAIDGHIRLADFGSAIIVGSEEYIQEHSQQPKKSKQLIGTPLYVSPEVIHNEPATEKSDLWAMGLIFFFLLAGRQLFSGQTQFILLQNIVKATYQLPVGFDEGARDLLSKLIVVDPNQRISIEEIKMHKFFAGTNWSTLHLQTPPINATFQNTSPQNQQQQTISPPKHNDISQVASSVLSNSLIRQQRRASQIAEAAESVFGVESITYAQARQRRSSSVTRILSNGTIEDQNLMNISAQSPKQERNNSQISNEQASAVVAAQAASLAAGRGRRGTIGLSASTSMGNHLSASVSGEKQEQNVKMMLPGLQQIRLLGKAAAEAEQIAVDAMDDDSSQSQARKRSSIAMHPFASSEGALFSPDLQTLNNTANNDKLFIQRNGQLTGQNEQQKEMVKLPVGENEYNPFENETSVDVPRAGEPMQSNRQNGDLVFNEENTDNPFQQLKGQRGIEMQNILAIVNRSDVLQQQEQGQQGRRRESSNIQGRRRSGIEVDIDANDIANFQNWIQCAINDGENDEIAQYNQQYQERALLQQRQEQEQKENRKKLLAERKAKKKQERDRQEQIRDEKRRKKLKRKDALLLGPDFQQDWDQAMSEINTRKVYDPNNWLYLDDCSSRSSQSEDDVASLSSSPETEEYKKEIRRRDRIKKRQQIKINKEMKRKKNLGKKGASEQYNSKTGIDVEDEEDEEDDDIVDDFDLFVQQNSDSINEGENSQINFSSLTDTSSYDSSDEKEAHFNGLLKYINTHKQELENQESYLYCVDNAMQVDIVKQKFTGKERRRHNNSSLNKTIRTSNRPIFKSQALFFSPLTGLSRPRSKSPNKNKKSPSPDHDQLHKKDTDKMYPHWTINIHDGESIIQKGFVDVWLKQGKKVRLMVLTSLNRCMLFDPKTNQLTGEIVLGTQVWAEAYDAVRLVVHTKLSNVVIDDPTKKDAMAWAENLNRATVAVTNSFSPQKRPQTMVQSSSAQHTNYNSGRHSK
ncbi:MAG: putative 3-phosphoinositide-dependent protein kinase 1 [Streblomastix strix]|uniref:non-specific serine/threonine protein kinase n=2 Tax=Streblomastix strix TaxID=222440 RepID=A0A5J4XAW0_9EUKA|nr:MAG: putative 3-phosphoinositide-dependent protein kinase 1 [Streblomastix strix]